MSLATGIFTPWQSKQGGNTGGTYMRMAGDYMDQFTRQNPEAKKIIEEPKSSVMNVMGGSDYKKPSKESTAAPATASTPATPATPAKPASNDAGMAKFNAAQDEIYKQNQAIIANYNGVNGANSTASGAAYNADLMAGIAYDRAVKQNAKMDANKKSQASIAAGNDHGSGEWKAPQSKEYYDYLKTYSGPKSYKATIGAGQEAYDTYDKWVKDSRHYKKAWEGIDYKKVDDSAAYGLP